MRPLTPSRRSFDFGRHRSAALASLVVAQAAALWFLAWRRDFTIATLLGIYAIAFAAYLAIVPLARRSRAPLWIWFIVAIAVRLPWLPTAPRLSDDVWRYLHDGRAQAAGVNPYRYPPSAPEAAAYAGPERPLINHPELRTVYPPAAQFTFRLAAMLGGTPLAWKIVLLLFDLGIGAAVALVLYRRGNALGGVAAYLLHPLPVIEFAGNGHVDAVAIALALLSLALLYHRPAVAGASVAASIAAKYLMLPLVPWLLRPLDRKGRIRCVAGIAIALGVLYVPFADYLSWGSFDTFVRSFEFNGSVYPILAQVWSPATTRWLLAGALTLVLAVMWWRRVEAESAMLGWVGALLLASPIVHPWYVTWLVPFLAWRREPWLLAWSGTIVLSYLVLPGWWAEGVWRLPGWVPFVEYAPVYAMLAWRGARALKTGEG